MAEQTCPCCGANFRISCNAAHPEHDCYHPDGHTRPQPDWREVIREFLKVGPYLLERRTMNGNRYWRYETDQRTKGGLREMVDILHFPTESTWILKLGLYGPHQVTLRNPTPAEALTGARLVGLIGGTS